MDERSGLAWLGRKIGWGLRPGQLEEWVARGAAEVIDEFVEPEANGVAARPNPFDDLDPDDGPARAVARGTVSWIEEAIRSPRPLETYMEFFWSDYFAVSTRVVRPPQLVFTHMTLLGRHGLGNFEELLRQVTIDPAMLEFLDGSRNTRTNPNENYARELLELYTVGVDNFDEDDVKAAARALTGWRARRRIGRAAFLEYRHDDRPRTLLGVDGVHDMTTVIEATLSHPATAPRVLDKLATAILGLDYDSRATEGLAEQFAQDWELRPIVRRLLELGVEGNATSSILEPLPWYVAARKLPLPPPDRSTLREFFSLTNQLPMRPPNVGGFPEPDAYLSTSATIARFNMASDLAVRADAGAGSDAVAALTGDVAALADRFGLVQGFAPRTESALQDLSPGVDRLAAALASPDMVVV